MKIRFLIIVFLSLNCWVFSQLPCPLKSGTFVIPKPNFYSVPDETMNRISSKNNKVFSLSKGKVFNIVSHADGTHTLIIRSENDELFVYSNLDNILLKIKDEVEKDQVIALARLQEETRNYILEFQFWKRTQEWMVDLNCKKPY